MKVERKEAFSYFPLSVTLWSITKDPQIQWLQTANHLFVHNLGWGQLGSFSCGLYYGVSAAGYLALADLGCSHMSGASARTSVPLSPCCLSSSKKPAYACSQGSRVSGEQQAMARLQGLMRPTLRGQCHVHHILLDKANCKTAWI